MSYISYIFIIIFFYLNIKIIISDLKIKKIPNKYLGYLLLLVPIYWIYLFQKDLEINIILFIIQIILTLIISFILYYFWIWAAWDAKYLLVLSLFIPHIWIISFIWNIWLITIIYLLLYFIYFYLSFIFLPKKEKKDFIKWIKKDFLKSSFFQEKKFLKKIIILLNNITFFLITFILIRLIRIYLFFNLLNKNNINNIWKYLNKYNFYIIFLFIWIYYLLFFLFNKLKNYLLIKYFFEKNIRYIKIFMKFILIILLISFIYYEYIINPYNIIINIKIILTYSIIIYILFRILKYSYEIAFYTSEIKEIPLNELKKWMILNMPYLKWKIERNDFQNIESDIKTKKDLEKVKWILKKLKQIEIINTFSFWIYIFIAFFITILYNNKIYFSIINYLFLLIKNNFTN